MNILDEMIENDKTAPVTVDLKIPGSMSLSETYRET